ncbi:DUF2127 domain-containing protein [Tersicoccus sp. MR15.9]|uniref:DUF2127 domain-containing protein n=1 Tax=Tersicoccus mangrovi TaxID=3121635 RepID=UPI002FE57BCB
MTERNEKVASVVFVLGIIGKGVDGLIEVIAGIPLLIFSPAALVTLSQTLTAEELRQDPHDLIANLIVHGAAHLTGTSAKIGAVYLLFHGIVKLAIVVALLIGTRRIYPWAMGALGVFLVIQIVQFAIAPSVGVALLTVLDALILWLTWREWRHGRSLRDALWTVRRDVLHRA